VNGFFWLIQAITQAIITIYYSFPKSSEWKQVDYKSTKQISTKSSTNKLIINRQNKQVDYKSTKEIIQ